MLGVLRHTHPIRIAVTDTSCEPAHPCWVHGHVITLKPRPLGAQANGADIHGGTWFETGAEMLNGGTLNYFAVPWGVIGNPLPLVLVTLIEVGLLGAVETYRCAKTSSNIFDTGFCKTSS